MQVGSASDPLQDVASASNTAPAATIPQDPDTCPDTCCICLETISERAVAVPCNHLQFDFICLASWAQEQPKCPLCNTTLTAIEYDWRAPDDFKRYRVPPRHSSTSNEQGSTARRQRGGLSRGQANRRPWARPQAHARPIRTSQEEATLSTRRHIYRHNLFSQHVGSNRHSRFRDFSPSTFARSSDLQSRARTFLRRELTVFDFSMQTVEFVLTYAISILKTVELKHSSGKAQELLKEFLGERHASLFCHELESWLRSPFTKLSDWDRWVQYVDSTKMPSNGETS